MFQILQDHEIHTVELSPEQFHQIRLLCDQLDANAISDGTFVDEAMKISTHFRRYKVNRIIVVQSEKRIADTREVA